MNAGHGQSGFTSLCHCWRFLHIYYWSDKGVSTVTLWTWDLLSMFMKQLQFLLFCETDNTILGLIPCPAFDSYIPSSSPIFIHFAILPCPLLQTLLDWVECCEECSNSLCCFSRWLHQSAFPRTACIQGAAVTLFSAISPEFGICEHFDDGHSGWCEEVPHGSVDLHFSDGWPWWVSFLTFWVSALERFVCLGLLPILTELRLEWMSCLCVLEIEPLLAASFASVFSQSKGCLFILFVVSFAVQRPVSLGSTCFCLLLLLLPWDADLGKRC